MANCNICKRELDTKDPTTEDCGGDCLRCMADHIEDPDCVKAMAEIRKSLNTEYRVYPMETGDWRLVTWFNGAVFDILEMDHRSIISELLRLTTPDPTLKIRKVKG